MVSLGKTNSSPYYRDQCQQDIMVLQVICHPQHCKQDNQPRLNDLALLQLQRYVLKWFQMYFTADVNVLIVNIVLTTVF